MQSICKHIYSHYEQSSMTKIVLRHYVHVRLLPMLEDISDTKCTIMCFKAEDLQAIRKDVRSMGADFDMELLLGALLQYRKAGVDRVKLCSVGGTLFTKDELCGASTRRRVVFIGQSHELEDHLYDSMQVRILDADDKLSTGDMGKLAPDFVESFKAAFLAGDVHEAPFRLRHSCEADC